MDIAESLISVLDEGTNLCLSGGADGADLQWGLQAGKAGHNVIHWSFNGHRSQAPEQEIVRLTREQLELADGALERANRAIKRRWPTKTESTNNLLRRNWYQVKNAEAVYAVSEVKSDTGIAGGTAWAVQMYLDRFLYDNEPADKCHAYVLDKNTLRWYMWNGSKWETMLSRPPSPKGIWAGIGSRELPALARVEIRKLMGTYVLDEQQLSSLHPLIEEPKLNDIIYVPERKSKNSMKCLGGWATVGRITSSDRLWLHVTEFTDVEFDWNELKPVQNELRSQYGMIRATAKPDYSN